MSLDFNRMSSRTSSQLKNNGTGPELCNGVGGVRSFTISSTKATRRNRNNKQQNRKQRKAAIKSDQSPSTCSTLLLGSKTKVKNKSAHPTEIEKTRHLTAEIKHDTNRENNTHETPENEIDIDDEIDTDYDTDFVWAKRGGTKKEEVTSALTAKTDAGGAGSHHSTDAFKREQQVERASKALTSFVSILYDRQKSHPQQITAASEWCVYRGLKREQGTVVVSVARHLKEASSSKARNTEIESRLNQMFKEVVA
jgi:hypothetical protein